GRERAGGRRCGAGGFEHANFRVANCVGVIVRIHLFDVGLAFFEVQMLDVILLATVDIDGFFVDGGQGAGKIHFADDAGLAGNVNDDEVVAGNAAQADGIGGISFVRPVKIFAGAMEVSGLGQA